MKKTVVIFVDHKQRDLPGDALIAHHLETKFNIRCVLEPLQSWKSCLAAYKPDYMIFNHMAAQHLVEYSRELNKMGVMVGVLLNEGIAFHKEVMDYIASKFHSDAHVDQYFSWNKGHKDAILANKENQGSEIHVVGIPRFDYYFEPWKKIFMQSFKENKKRVLFCTSFMFVNFVTWPKKKVDGVFFDWAEKMPIYRDYWKFIEQSVYNRNVLLDFVKVVLDTTDYIIDLKPHPREDSDFYDQWISKLPMEQRERIVLRVKETIWDVMALCDVHISCETCTTSIEAWLSNKPTIELVFDKHPVFFHEEMAVNNPLCDTPAKLVEMINRYIKDPTQMEYSAFRESFLEKWCATPSGDSCYRIAEIIATSLAVRERPIFKIGFDYRRKALKLRIKNVLNLSYGSNPVKLLKAKLAGKKIDAVEAKYINPSDVKAWREKLKKAGSQTV